MSLFDTLKSSAAGLIGGGAHEALTNALAGSPLGGMSGLLDQLNAGGLGSAVAAWTSGQDHPAIGVDQLQAALGDEHVQQLASSLGIDPGQLLSGLSEHLPALAAQHATATGDSAQDS
jgi:uncharacterized protein YidB (DUF937 family)